MRTHLVAAIGLTFCAALGAASGCASDAGPVTGEGTAAQGEALSSTLDAHYYTVRREVRTCGLTLCRDYLLAELNTAGPEHRAARIDFSSAHLDDAAITAALGAPAGELVVYGALRPSTDEGATLGVQRAFLGLPDLAASTDDGFYVVNGGGTDCRLAPCDGETAYRLETGTTEAIASVSLERAAALRVDTAWLQDRVLHHGAVVAGQLRRGVDAAGAEALVLDAAEVYDPLPDPGGPCLLQVHHCAAPTSPVYARDVNRCLVFQGCHEPRVCPDFRLGPCEDGYTKVRWATAGPACWAEVCDPAFLAE